MRRKRKQDDSHIDESWLIPYADLLTLLLALFIVLFAMSDLDAQKYKELSLIFQSEFGSGSSILDESSDPIEIPESTNQDTEEEEEKDEETEVEKEKEENEARELLHLQELRDRINNYIATNELTDVLGTELLDEGLLITIVNDITFDSGSAEVKSEGQKIAKEVSNFLYTDPPHQIVISGHADDRPMSNADFASNWELSVIRAVNFMHLILENEKLVADRFSAKGYGENHPIVPNTTEENRAKNRRVEVLILPNYEINVDGEKDD
ncbi:flagellar motor protein MotB [Virgibacillus sp. C22-A2]|uniref:Flagellar motor protein MotB n=1 Tax=Virgibacillus tibetensis TaxID=3042313 RepID=A0ABU6KDM3_9BACI|nr:flagellar motor protein MotB [Virgibacillus sp. C22-A2]